MVRNPVRGDARRSGDTVSRIPAEADWLQGSAQVRPLLHLYDAVRLQSAMIAKLIGITLMACWACAQEVHVLPVQGNVSMIVGPGGNITVQAGKEGIVVVDTQ